MRCQKVPYMQKQEHWKWKASNFQIVSAGQKWESGILNTVCTFKIKEIAIPVLTMATFWLTIKKFERYCLIVDHHS